LKDRQRLKNNNQINELKTMSETYRGLHAKKLDDIEKTIPYVDSLVRKALKGVMGKLTKIDD
jgi:hypothetical protein